MTRSGRRSAVWLGLALLASAARADRVELSAQAAAGLTYNDNITLSRADVNFGPGVLARDDLLGHARVRAAAHLDKTELAYTGSRTRFTKNPELGFAEHTLELNHEKLAQDWLHLRAQMLFARVDPDELVRADASGAFPFTTSEPPDRQVLQLIAGTPPERQNEFQVRALSQRQQYSNNPLLDSNAQAVLVHLGRKVHKKCSVAAEVQEVDRNYPNLVGDTPLTTVEAPSRNLSFQVAYAPNQHFGYLAKVMAIDQDSNVDTFFLNQFDVSLGASWEIPNWNATLLVQGSRRDFERRPAAGGTQLDRDLLAQLSVTRALGNRSAVSVSFTRDRNRSNVADFDYSNNIARVELSRSF